MFLEKPMFIRYTFTLDDGKTLTYRIELDRCRAPLPSPAEYPQWTRLNFQQCANCPLHQAHYPHCPVAIDAYEIITGFNEILSFNEMDVRVETPERRYFKRCDAQTGLRSLIGFVMATSGCPVLSPLRGMAYYHLPFASLDEIVYRVASSYLLGQYFIYKDGGQPDLELEGLKQQYKEIQIVNYDFLQRIRVASEADASLDVLSTLFSIASLLSSLSLEKHLQGLKPFFAEQRDTP